MVQTLSAIWHNTVSASTLATLSGISTGTEVFGRVSSGCGEGRPKFVDNICLCGVWALADAMQKATDTREAKKFLKFILLFNYKYFFFPMLETETLEAESSV